VLWEATQQAQGRYLKREVNERGLPDVPWHGTQLNKVGRHDPQPALWARIAAMGLPEAGPEISPFPG
jgi:hypothetical protein